MTKVATIASLVRSAAKDESEFINTVNAVFDEGDVERIAEFFDRLNIPRSQGAEGNMARELPILDKGSPMKVWGFEEEHKISLGIQRYLDRHERKIKWHASHPSLEGSENVLLLFRAAIVVTNMRLRRLVSVLKGQDEMSPLEWSIARTLMNNSYLSFRNFLSLAGTDWIDSVQVAVSRDELVEKVGNFYELVDQQIRDLENFRVAIEERRADLAVLPEGYPPVKPPNYFGGDLLGRGPWKQYWTQLNAKAHHFREALG